MEVVKKPPLGLIPKYVRDAQRKREIFEAMERFSTEKVPIPLEWIEELKELCN